MMALLLASLCIARAVAADPDAATLVQRAVYRAGQNKAELNPVGDSVVESALGPVANTPLGAIQGKYEDNYAVFRGVKYQEPPPLRFSVGSQKQPWAPQMYDATKFRPSCIGAHTLVEESEDCFHMNIWLPKSGGTNLPVIVYFHGGMNQHGSGAEPIRQGDMIVQSNSFPVIFINFDYRLGIFGWLSFGREHPHSRHNVGFLDQQEALRFVQKNIRSFGGDPSRVTLQSQSEGSSTILAHMVAPGSKDLFHRVVMHSPVADVWLRDANQKRSEFMTRRSGCSRKDESEMYQCLLGLPAQQLWSADWVAEELSRNLASPVWMANFFTSLDFNSGMHADHAPGYIGWHPHVDGDVIPGEPRELIAQGKWHKVPVLITISKNESTGVVPGGALATGTLNEALNFLFAHDDVNRVKKAYSNTLEESNITGTTPLQLQHLLLTDKMWTCEARALAKDITEGGGRAYLEMFWKNPKYDPIGSMTSVECTKGATCHASEMFYVLPQGRNVGIHGSKMEQEIEFSRIYSNAFLSFVHGSEDTWARYDIETQRMTFFDENGARMVPRYRKEQCDVLDSSMGDLLPGFMKRRAIMQ